MTPALRWLSLEGRRATLVVDATGEYEASALIQRSLAIAASLAPRGPLRGERVAILIEPGALFLASLFGVWLAGGVALVLSPLHPAAERRYFCEDARVRTVLASQAYEALADELSAALIRPDAIANPVAAFRPHLPAAESPALQLYTSGTTAKPKGAVLTHANLATQQDLVADAWAVTADDTLVHGLPLHHMHGLCIAALTASAGVRQSTLLPNLARPRFGKPSPAQASGWPYPR